MPTRVMELEPMEGDRLLWWLRHFHNMVTMGLQQDLTDPRQWMLRYESTAEQMPSEMRGEIMEFTKPGGRAEVHLYSCMTGRPPANQGEIRDWYDDLFKKEKEDA